MNKDNDSQIRDMRTFAIGHLRVNASMASATIYHKSGDDEINHMIVVRLSVKLGFI